jgi:hypothetical protein
MLWWRTTRNTGIALVAVAVLLLLARALLPVAIQRYVNRVLDRDETYEGRIGDVDVALFRGAYEIEDVQIRKRGGKVPVPFFSSPLVDLSIEWRALFDGSLVGEVAMERPELNLVAGSTSARSQAGAGVDWRKTVEDLFPLRINRFTARDGSVHFRAFDTEPQVNVYLQHVDLVARNLTNSLDLSESRVASLEVHAVPMNAGRLRMRASFDPFSERPDFDFDGQVTGADLTQWNDFLRAYAGIDVQRGGFALYAELLAHGNRFEGYVKPFLRHVDVLRLDEELEEQGLLASLWEGIVGMTQEAFENQPDDRLATRIPISGTVENPDVGFWATLANVLRNAFVKALVPQLEDSVGER